MILGIDASNIRAGGGLTHLIETLNNAKPLKHGFNQVVVWSNDNTLSKIPEKDWLLKIKQPILNKSFVHRLFWRLFRLKKQIHKNKCDVIFVPGGTDSSGFKPIVSMSQNMLPFEWKELSRFGFSLLTMKLLILRYTQSNTFKKSNGVIFLTNYACNEIAKQINNVQCKKTIIPHGIDERFFAPLNDNHKDFSLTNPYKIVYVSIVDMYKHQWQVAKAIAKIRAAGIPITLDLIGPAYTPALKKLNAILDIIDPNRKFIFYRGAIPHNELQNTYKTADINVFASSCENLPNILLEAMASGLPIACSNRGPMPEVLGDAGIYFDPENFDEIAEALMMLISSPQLRQEKALLAYERAQHFSWNRCADDTFQFIATIAQEWQNQQSDSLKVN